MIPISSIPSILCRQSICIKYTCQQVSLSCQSVVFQLTKHISLDASKLLHLRGLPNFRSWQNQISVPKRSLLASMDSSPPLNLWLRRMGMTCSALDYRRHWVQAYNHHGIWAAMHVNNHAFSLAYSGAARVNRSLKVKFGARRVLVAGLNLSDWAWKKITPWFLYFVLPHFYKNFDVPQCCLILQR